MAFDVPILFLVFNRPETTKEVFQRIKDIQPAKLFVAADGPRAGKEGEEEKCEAVRRLILDGIDWPCKVETLFRFHNLGCGNAVSSAITWFFDNVEVGIILEDDTLPDPLTIIKSCILPKCFCIGTCINPFHILVYKLLRIDLNYITSFRKHPFIRFDRVPEKTQRVVGRKIFIRVYLKLVTVQS